MQRFSRSITAGFFLAFMLLLGPSAPARAGGKVTAARELAEMAIRKFGGKAAVEGAESLTRRIVSASARYGDDAVTAAIRRVGPRALSLADEAGEGGLRALRLLGQHGDDAAVWVLNRPGARKLLAEYGDDTATLLIRHKGIAEPVIEGLGQRGVNALGAVGPEGGRRMAMMLNGGELARIGRTDELLGVIAKHGDRACDFIWRNKGALAVSASLAAFLSDPEPFLNHTTKLAETAATAIVTPGIRAASEATGHITRLLSYVLLGLALIGLAMGVLAARFRAVRAVLFVAGKLCLRRFKHA